MLGKLKIITAAELMDKQLLPRTVVVDQLLSSGTYILAGTPKIGKSFLMTQLCWCVSEGKPFLEHDTMQSTVLYLALEDTDTRLQERLNRMFGVGWLGENLHLVFYTDLHGKNLICALEEFVFLHPETRLIVIDTLQRAKSGGDGSYSYSNDYEAIKPFKEFTDAHDLALILVHHTRKNIGSLNPFDQISGTNGLMGAADGAFVLYTEKEEITLSFVGRDFPMQRYTMCFDSARCMWEILRSSSTSIRALNEPLLDIIDRVVGDVWVGTATDLLEAIKKITPEIELQPNILTRKLNALTGRLEREKAIVYRKSRTSELRQLVFERIILR